MIQLPFNSSIYMTVFLLEFSSSLPFPYNANLANNFLTKVPPSQRLSLHPVRLHQVTEGGAEELAESVLEAVGDLSRERVQPL